MKHITMQVRQLFLPPEQIHGHVIAYHPYCDVVCAAGQTERDASITWLQPQTDDPIPQIPSPAWSNSVLNNKPTAYTHLPTAPELVLPLSSLSSAAFSKCGRYLALIGQDADRERLFVYRVKLPAKYSQIENDLLRPLTRLDLPTPGLCELSWSPDSSYVAVGSQTGSILIVPVRTHIIDQEFDNDKIRQGAAVQQIKAVGGQVIGLSWSSCGYYLAVQSHSELAVLVRAANSKTKQFRKTPFFYRSYLDKGSERFAPDRKAMRTYFAVALYRRQCAFSPDSNFLVSTAGVHSYAAGVHRPYTFCTYCFTLKNLCDLEPPSVTLPGQRCPSVAVAFSPVLYELSAGKKNVSNLPYRMLFAVASGCDVCLYDTQDFGPLFYYEGENYQTDYVTSLGFNCTGRQLCAFGAHFQYQFFDLSHLGLETYSVKITNEAEASLTYTNETARLKAGFCLKLAAHESGKIKSRPPKPAGPVKQIPLFDRYCRFWAVGERGFSCQQPMNLQIEKDEIERIQQSLGCRVEKVAAVVNNVEETVSAQVQMVQPADDQGYVEANVKE